MRALHSRVNGMSVSTVSSGGGTEQSVPLWGDEYNTGPKVLSGEILESRELRVTVRVESFVSCPFSTIHQPSIMNSRPSTFDLFNMRAAVCIPSLK